MLNATGIIFNRARERVGRLRLTRLGFIRMQEYKLTPEILREVFRYGRQVDPGKLTYEYGDYSVGMLCDVDQVQVFRGDLTQVRVIIITCWKRWHKEGRSLTLALRKGGEQYV